MTSLSCCRAGKLPAGFFQIFPVFHVQYSAAKIQPIWSIAH